MCILGKDAVSHYGRGRDSSGGEEGPKFADRSPFYSLPGSGHLRASLGMGIYTDCCCESSEFRRQLLQLSGGESFVVEPVVFSKMQAPS